MYYCTRTLGIPVLLFKSSSVYKSKFKIMMSKSIVKKLIVLYPIYNVRKITIIIWIT